MKKVVIFSSYYGTMRDVRLFMDSDKFERLQYGLELFPLQFLVSEDYYALKSGSASIRFTASQIRKLRRTLGTDFYNFITLK